MDLSAVNWNVTIDDFDSLLTYTDQSAWNTPDPSIIGFNATSSPWLRGTFHNTTTKGASVCLNITGPSVYVYGNTGPSYGSYEVNIDTFTMQYSAFRESATDKSTLLFAASNLTYANHVIIVRNLGALPGAGDKGGDAFLLDYIDTTIQLAPAGATVQNATHEEHDPAITFTGIWGNNSSPNFSGGTSTFTNQDNASFSFSFHGSAIYVFGDKKNDHRFYSVTLDSSPPITLNGISGCGGAFGMTCEQQAPSIKYLASNLDDSLHQITLVNHANVNSSFFDLDSIVVTVPSQYGPRQLSTSSSPFASSVATTPSSISPGSATSIAKSSASATHSFALNAIHPLLFLTTLMFYLLRPTFGRPC
ncbi:hypothetical protein CPB84DRAFT_1048079 [Gymnopilus junonius]|uniref:Uncharacterized protein n=1 Tax=Gymnopilus junonius TaxID=109634 RepID=A0A9P5NKB8_GYMJU|nr:hypothetical protein CPB84DRAFT_1048079 [Gymnopilus junonius]